MKGVLNDPTSCPFADGRGLQPAAPVGCGAGPGGLAQPADQTADCLSGRWAHRHHHARAGGKRLSSVGANRGGGEPARRGRHAAGPANAAVPTRWPHAGPGAAGRVSHALYAKDELGPAQGPELHHWRDRLCLRPGGAHGFTDQDLGRLRGLCQGQSWAAVVWVHGRADQPAPDHGGHRHAGGRGAQPHPLQGQCRLDAGDPGRPDHGGGRLHGLCAARGQWAASGAQHLGGAAPAQVPRRAHPHRAGHSPGAGFPVWDCRSQGHGPQLGAAHPRCLQAGDGTALARGGAGPL